MFTLRYNKKKLAPGTLKSWIRQNPGSTPLLISNRNKLDYNWSIVELKWVKIRMGNGNHNTLFLFSCTNWNWNELY